jgi:erythromycin esterase-like protein
VLREFRRWPTWMWANREVPVFVEWLRGFNQGRPPDRRVGFYGLDVYSLWESLELVMAYAQLSPTLVRTISRRCSSRVKVIVSLVMGPG